MKKSTLDRSNQKITYDKLKEYIKKNHPTKLIEEGQDTDMIRYFGLCDRLGVLPILRCCNSKASPLAQELGIGASLFLMTTKAMATLFMVLTIINIPIFAFYYSGTTAASEAEGSAAQATSFQDYFALLSLGNAGAGNFACDELSVANEQYELKLKCGLGTIIGQLKEIGFVKSPTETCADLYENPGSFND